MIEYQAGNLLEAERLLAEARRAVQSQRDPETNYLGLESSRALARIELDIMFREAEAMIVPDVKRWWRTFSQRLVGGWSAVGNLLPDEGSGDAGGAEFKMLGMFRPVAGGRAVVGTQTLQLANAPQQSFDGTVTFGWDPVEKAVQVTAYWSEGSLERITLNTVDGNSLRGRNCLQQGTGRQQAMDIVLQPDGQDEFAWIIQSGPATGRNLSCWQRVHRGQ
jgi:hypothetical protein